MQARDSLPHDTLLLAEVARLYYQDDLSQDQIAKRTGVSRSSISRMLKEARDRGIVEIRVHHPYQTDPRLESALKEPLGLKECLVLVATPVEAMQEGDLAQRVGALAARYLAESVANGSTLGIGWGSMVDSVVRSGYFTNKRDMTVVQIQGGVGGATQDIDGARIVNTLARSLGATAAYLNAPMVVADAAVRTGLLRDQHIRQTLDLGRRADAMLVGVGAVSRQSGLYRAGYLNDADLLYIEGEGAVGDICGHYFRADGSPCALEVDDRTVALPAEAMLKVPLRVGVSSGAAKALPNIGGARSGLINVLVTDQQAAEAMLALLDTEGSPGVSQLSIDLGATSGRAMLGTLRAGALEIREVHRFPNPPARLGNRIHWDLLRLLGEIKQAIGRAVHEADDTLTSFGIDTWGLDYGLLDGSDQLLSNPYHYRDMGSRPMQTELRRRIAPAELYRRTGIQSIPFNTLDQLLRLQDERPWLLADARTLLMTPDLFRFFLTGEKQNEYTIASTSQCLSIETSDWDTALLNQCGIPAQMFAPIVPPGSPGGMLRESVARELGVSRIGAVAIAEHDTASAMIATGGKPGEAFLSLGTWGLLGAIVERPIVSEAAFRANIANEGGVGGTWRFLRNIMGLWLLEQCRHAWENRGIQFDHDEMVRQIETADPLRAFIDPDDSRLVDPPDLPEAIGALTGLEPDDTGAILRCVTDSLAMKCRYVLEQIETAGGLAFPGLHVLGGGSKNAPLCQAMADALGRPVWAGPAEATVIGNLLVQLLASGEIDSIEEGAALVTDNHMIRRCDPVESDRWQDTYEAYCGQFGLVVQV